MIRKVMTVIAPTALWIGAALPAPAMAQDRTDSAIDEVVAFERDVSQAISAGTLSRKDGTYLQGRTRVIRRFFNKISSDGVSLAEAQMLRDRINFLRTRYGVGIQESD